MRGTGHSLLRMRVLNGKPPTRARQVWAFEVSGQSMYTYALNADLWKCVREREIFLASCDRCDTVTRVVCVCKLRAYMRLFVRVSV